MSGKVLAQVGTQKVRGIWVSGQADMNVVVRALLSKPRGEVQFVPCMSCTARLNVVAACFFCPLYFYCPVGHFCHGNYFVARSEFSAG